MKARFVATWLVSALLSIVRAGHLAAQAAAQPAPAPVALPDTLDPKLVGNRFRPLTWAEMSEAQKAMTRHVLDGPRTAMSGPFNVMLRWPAMGDFAQELGAQVRFNSTLPPALRELTIDDATFAAAKAAFGEQGVAEIVFTLGYYGLVSMLLNVDEHPLPAGVAPELAP